MSIRNLDRLFTPASVAVIGASAKPQHIGSILLRNLLSGAFRGAVYAVNPSYSSLEGLMVYRTVRELPVAPDLALICTPPSTIPGLIAELGEIGVRAAIVISAGLSARDADGRSYRDSMLAAAQPYMLRILGPNCVGLLIPGIGLNASFAQVDALPGKLAFVSQSGAMVTAVLDWARSRGIGFSKFLSLGDSADIDFGDVLDFLARDAGTDAILLYMEAVTSARKFMSAARAASRAKPTVVIKAGRVPEGARAATSHTGALAGSDDVYDAALRRAGMLRVLTTEDLFNAVETLSRAKRLHGNRLVVLTNGGGPGIMATDTLISAGGTLAVLSEATLGQLDAVLPPNWSHGDPVDIVGDAPVARYLHVMQVLLAAPEVDAVLFIHAPTAISPSAAIAEALAPVVKAAARNVLACWLGGESVAMARRIFMEAGIATYQTPEDAVAGFLQMACYRRNQDLLMEVPPAPSMASNNGRPHAKALMQQALASGRTTLAENEAKTVLSAYGVPVVPTEAVANIDEAELAATRMGYPVAMKIISPDIVHKSDVGGVALALSSAAALRQAGSAMMNALATLRPDARIDGFSVQPMIDREEGWELIAGIATDPVFGPVILFGQGGVGVEVVRDHAIALPPLNMVLARDTVQRTRVARLLAGYRGFPAADIDAICLTLTRLSDLLIDVPEIVELDINPLLASSKGVLALDARIRLNHATGNGRLAIHPYPVELEERIAWRDTTLLLRPIKPEDGPAHLAFFHRLAPADVHWRTFGSLRDLNRSQIARLTQIDYAREMAFVAIRPGANAAEEIVGVARAIADPDNVHAEFAIIVRSDVTQVGLGHLLLDKLIRYCRQAGIQFLEGETLADNRRLFRLLRGFAFEVGVADEDNIVPFSLKLQ